MKFSNSFVSRQLSLLCRSERKVLQSKRLSQSGRCVGDFSTLITITFFKDLPAELESGWHMKA